MKKVFNIFSLLSLFFCLVISTSNYSYSQSYGTFQYEIEEIKNMAKWKIGPFRIYPTIQFNDIGYDDNVYRLREDQNPISDFTATISPRFKAYLLYRNKVIFSFLENPELVYFSKEKNQRSLNHSFSPELKFIIFNRFILSGSYQFQRAKRRATWEFDSPVLVRTKGYNLSFFYQTGRGTSFGITGSIRRFKHENIEHPAEEKWFFKFLNREERTTNFEFKYRIFSETMFFLNGGYTEYNFQNEESRWKNSYSYQVYSGLQFPLLGRLRGSFSLGYKRLTTLRATKKGFSGLVGNADLSFRIGRFDLRFQYGRDSKFSYWTNNVFFLEDRYGTGISFYLTQFLRIDYNFTYGRISYPEPIIFRTPEEKYIELRRNDTIYIHNPGIVFRIVRNIGVGVSLNFWDRESNMAGIMRSNMFVGGYITYNF